MPSTINLSQDNQDAFTLSAPLDVKVKDGWCEVAYEGDFKHPVTERKFSLNKALFDSWLSYFQKLKALGNSIPLVKQHSVDPTDRLGTIEDMRIDPPSTSRNVYSIWFKPKYQTEELATKLKDASFSASFVNNMLEATGERVLSALMHIGVTDYPVLKGLQKEFSLSTIYFEKDLTDLHISKGANLEESPTPPTVKTKPLKDEEMSVSAELKKSLGLGDDADEAAVLSAIEVLKTAPTQLSAMYKNISEQRKERVKNLSISEEDKKKFEPLCTEKQVAFDMTSGVDTFAMAFDFAQKSQKQEGFRTGDQNLSSEFDPSKDGLMLAMENMNKQFTA